MQGLAQEADLLNRKQGNVNIYNTTQQNNITAVAMMTATEKTPLANEHIYSQSTRISRSNLRPIHTTRSNEGRLNGPFKRELFWSPVSTARSDGSQNFWYWRPFGRAVLTSKCRIQSICLPILADRTVALILVLRPSVCRLSVYDVMYCG